MIVKWAHKLRSVGVDALRGGAYKPCTYPITKSVGENGWKEGLREKGLKFLITAREETGLPIVSEIMDVRQIDTLSMDAIDMIQIGTRNFQNYTLLDELGKLDKNVLLKRGTWGTLDEILGECLSGKCAKQFLARCGPVNFFKNFKENHLKDRRMPTSTMLNLT